MTVYASFKYRFLNRRGYCSLCSSEISPKGPKVFTFVGKSRRQEIICPLCISNLYGITQGDNFVEVADG